jgi:hypothetical protein
MQFKQPVKLVCGDIELPTIAKVKLDRQAGLKLSLRFIDGLDVCVMCDAAIREPSKSLLLPY